MKQQLLTGALAVGAVAIGSLVQVNPAEALTLTSQLLGDPRANNPDGLIVDVTVKTGTDAGLSTNQALWTVDINSPLHSNIKLGQFFFNLANAAASNYTFSGFNPTGWAIQTPANNANGSGSADFIFKALDPSGPPNAANVTNNTNLSFIMTKGLGAITEADFLTAPFATSNNNLLGSFHLGAHLQSLTVNATTCPSKSTCRDSGFARGNYTSTPIPTPALLPGLIGMGVAALRKKKGEQNLESVAQEA
ncbi:PTPA-CTERM sorting domain-containing protein [Oculatella sp. LEGE 06141]|uniref:PTPA-CTERM sorting domain-containing protein n=1 Tax=Oculatella sp. LEGE 06141 TaxID=1828648 RepID=UPI0018810387|nr:PTPA-CTERM sorting domain-containing protein [Oculatella sp. LEGE 06141]MBE9179531.1 PTPA-CTERM sorting domain-containing protein [Oculatella sp. LEGE 06141]